MEVIVLAGGLGTRLRKILNELPKPMAQVRNKPFLEYVLAWLSEYSVTKIILSVGYKHEIISDYFKNFYKNIPVEYAVELEPLGTGGGILNALSHVNDENVLIVNGDTFFPINIDFFSQEHLRMEGKITIALKELAGFNRYGSVNLDTDNNITLFHEKKHQDQGLINGGIYLLNTDFIKNQNLPLKFSFEKEILEKEAINKKIKGIRFDNHFLDIGVPEDYFKAGQIL